MKVVLKRDLYLGGVLYRASPTGTEIPDEIDKKKVRLTTKEDSLKMKQYAAEMAAQGYSEIEVAEDEIRLPIDAEEYKAPPEGQTATVKTSPDTMSQLTPPPPMPRPTAEHPNPNVKTTQKK